MNTCTSCQKRLSTEAFLHKGKFFKTCSTCLIARSEKRAVRRASLTNSDLSEREREIESAIEEVTLDDMTDYVTSKIVNLEQNSGLSFNLCVELDDSFNAIRRDVKLMVRLIVDEIERGDGYDWV